MYNRELTSPIPIPRPRQGPHTIHPHKHTKKKISPARFTGQGRHKEKKAASYSPALHCSTIGAGGLNFSVRNGKRWDTAAITT